MSWLFTIQRRARSDTINAKVYTNRSLNGSEAGRSDCCSSRRCSSAANDRTSRWWSGRRCWCRRARRTPTSRTDWWRSRPASRTRSCRCRSPRRSASTVGSRTSVYRSRGPRGSARSDPDSHCTLRKYEYRSARRLRACTSRISGLRYGTRPSDGARRKARRRGKKVDDEGRAYPRVWRVSIRRDLARERREGRACTPDRPRGIPPGMAVQTVYHRLRRQRRRPPRRRCLRRSRYRSRDSPSPPRGRSPRRFVRVPYGAATRPRCD